MSTTECPAGQTCLNGFCRLPRDGATDLGTDGNGTNDINDTGTIDSTPACSEGMGCPGGICIAGACCPAANACGAACCGATETCFANACVVPGRVCRTSADCDPGAYCESSLGGTPGTDGGVPDASADAGGMDAPPSDAGPRDAGGDGGGRVCSSPLPVPGRCLALPPRCPSSGDGGTGDASGSDSGGADGGGACISRCEYRPPAGRLTAEVAWSWGQPVPPRQYPEHLDVWSTPAVGRIYDANCDGHVDSLDPPNLVFVSGRAIHATTGIGTCCQCTATTPTACHTGVLRVLDGRTGADLLAVRSASMTSTGFSGVSVALGDIDSDGDIDIAAVTGEGYVVIVDGSGAILRTSDMPIPGAANAAFGWGGGLAIADMEGDGSPEIAFGSTVFTTAGGTLRLRFTGAGGTAGSVSESLSTFADVDSAADRHLELVAGRTVYRADGTVLWNRTDLTDGFPAVADFDGDGRPEIVLVTNGTVYILNGATGATRAGPLMLPGTGAGGPPTVADFDGTPGPEIGVAQQNFYSVLDVDLARMRFTVLWRRANHDLSREPAEAAETVSAE